MVKDSGTVARATALVERVDRLVPPAIYGAGGDERRRGRLTTIAALLGSAMMVATAVSAIFLAPESRSSLVSAVSFCAFGAFPAVFRRVRSLSIYANSFISLAFLGQVAFIVGAGGTDVGSLFALACVPLAAMLLAGPASGLLFMFLCFGTIVALAAVPPGIGFPEVDPPEAAIMLVRDTTFVLVGVTAFAALYDWVRTLTLREAQEARVRAEDSERKFAKAFSANPGSLFITDRRAGVILECNETFLDVVGASSPSAVLGRPFSELSNGGESLIRAAASLAGASAVAGFEYEIDDVNGRTRTFVAAATEIEIEGELRLLVLGSDDTERRAAEKVVLEANAQLEQRVRERTKELEHFTYAVSHDLKSPLVTIEGFLRVLQEDALAGDAERVTAHVARMRRATGVMKQLLADLFELSRAGRISSEPQEIVFEELAREAADLTEAERAERGAKVEIRSDATVVFGDRKRILQVVQNLIANAVRYMGDQSEPRVEIGVRDDSGKNVFYVRDNGIGIDPTHHDHIFGLFNQLNPDGVGTGVGLALVKRIVEVHGGLVWVESEGEGMGSCFCFTLPGQEERRPQPAFS